MIKAKVCKICGEAFTPARSMQSVCSPRCAIKDAQNKRQEKHLREVRKTQRKERKKLKSRSDWMKEAQAAFNRYIRLRDKDEPCISCQRHHDGQYHAGHYRTVGANPELRFDENNVMKQCSACNNHLSGNLVNYRINLIKKIGLSAVEELEGHHPPKKYTIEDLKEIKQRYTKLAKQMEDNS